MTDRHSTGTPDPADLEQAMITAITAYFKAHEPTGKMTALRAVEIRAVTDNGDLPSGGRAMYRVGLSTQDLLVLAAPWTGNGTGAADAPMIRTYSDS